LTVDDEIIERLDLLIALMRIGFSEQLTALRDDAAAEPVAAAVLEAVGAEWINSGDLQRSVAKTMKVSERTVLRAITALADRGLIKVRGTGRQTSYRRSGLL